MHIPDRASHVLKEGNLLGPHNLSLHCKNLKKTLNCYCLIVMRAEISSVFISDCLGANVGQRLLSNPSVIYLVKG